MPKRRLGVVLLIPSPADREVDGLRRACGDGMLGPVPPHITLVPPVNVREDALSDALGVVRRGAAATRPLRLSIGPPATFLPVNPVLYLSVGGELDGLVDLRDRIFSGPLQRPLSWPFVPHVTVAEAIEEDRITAALVALSSYRTDVVIDRVHVLEEQPGRSWVALADYPLAPPVVVGRGGLPLELVTSDLPDPEAATLTGPGFTITARRHGAVVGSATVAMADATAELLRLEVDASCRREGIGTHLLAAACSEAATRGAGEVAAPLLGSFLRERGWVADTDGRYARRTL